MEPSRDKYDYLDKPQSPNAILRMNQIEVEYLEKEMAAAGLKLKKKKSEWYERMLEQCNAGSISDDFKLKLFNFLDANSRVVMESLYFLSELNEEGTKTDKLYRQHYTKFENNAELLRAMMKVEQAKATMKASSREGGEETEERTSDP